MDAKRGAKVVANYLAQGFTRSEVVRMLNRDGKTKVRRKK